MKLRETVEERMAWSGHGNERSRAIDILEAVCPDNELSFDDLDCVSGGTVGPEGVEANNPFDRTLYLMIIAFNIEPEDDINSIGLIKNRIATKIKEMTGETLSPSLEEFTDNALREFFANKP